MRVVSIKLENVNLDVLLIEPDDEAIPYRLEKIIRVSLDTKILISQRKELCEPVRYIAEMVMVILLLTARQTLFFLKTLEETFWI